MPSTDTAAHSVDKEDVQVRQSLHLCATPIDVVCMHTRMCTGQGLAKHGGLAILGGVIAPGTDMTGRFAEPMGPFELTFGRGTCTVMSCSNLPEADSPPYDHLQNTTSHQRCLLHPCCKHVGPVHADAYVMPSGTIHLETKYWPALDPHFVLQARRGSPAPQDRPEEVAEQVSGPPQQQSMGMFSQFMPYGGMPAGLNMSLPSSMGMGMGMDPMAAW